MGPNTMASSSNSIQHNNWISALDSAFDIKDVWGMSPCTSLSPFPWRLASDAALPGGNCFCCHHVYSTTCSGDISSFYLDFYHTVFLLLELGKQGWGWLGRNKLYWYEAQNKAALYSSHLLFTWIVLSVLPPPHNLHPRGAGWGGNVNDTSLWNSKHHITTLTCRQCPCTKHMPGFWFSLRSVPSPPWAHRMGGKAARGNRCEGQRLPHHSLIKPVSFLWGF